MVRQLYCRTRKFGVVVQLPPQRNDLFRESLVAWNRRKPAYGLGEDWRLKKMPAAISTMPAAPASAMTLHQIQYLVHASP